MTEALIITGGEAPPPSRILRPEARYQIVCAADSGLDTAIAWGIVPDIIVGDMDSLADPAVLERFSGSEVLRHPVHKDDTDTELALALVRARTDADIVLAGGGGGRLDHLLAIRALFERKVRPAQWHTAHEAVYLVASGTRIELPCAAGATVSVFPLARGARRMESGGLQWPLDGLLWDAGGFGISNLSVGEGFWVRAGEGDLLVILRPEDSGADILI